MHPDIQAPRTATRDSLLAQLRAETRSEHDAIEAALELSGPALTQGAYRRTLERFYGFYLPLEAGLCAAPALAGRGLAIEERCAKARLIERDLEALGVDLRRVPLCPELPPHADLPAGLGCVYVLEGATLGGQVIARHARYRLGIGPEAGGAFFHGYGARTGAMWEAFRGAAGAIALALDERADAVAAARATFRTLRRWCEGARR